MTDENKNADPASAKEDVRIDPGKPDPSPLSGAELLAQLASAVGKFVFLTAEQADAVALWVLQTHVFDTAAYAPRLAITSALPRCGKSRLLEVMEPLVRNPVRSGSLTPAVVFRYIDSAPVAPTLLIDEGDTFLNADETLNGILNMGHRRGGVVMRCVGNDHVPKKFNVFSPVAIAKIGKLNPALSDRCIHIKMQRAGNDERRPPLNTSDIRKLADIGQLCARWATENRVALTSLEPSFPDWLVDRAANNWETLFAIAQLCGGGWPERAEHAARVLQDIGQEAPLTEADRLLFDVRGVFTAERATKLPSKLLCARLNHLEESPWRRMDHGRGLDPSKLAELLEPYAIKPKRVRWEEQSLRGYELDQFEQAFRRYLPPINPTDATASH